LNKHIANAASEKINYASSTIWFFLLRKISGNGQTIICFRSAKNLSRTEAKTENDIFFENFGCYFGAGCSAFGFFGRNFYWNCQNFVGGISFKNQ